MTETLKHETLKQRLLLDIAELQKDPYPKINLHIQEQDLTRSCLVLDTDRYGALHLTVETPSSFPLDPPEIRMDSDIRHPNVFDDYICASILNTEEGYTPAYTLKGIAIQLLSFFDSDKIEQEGGGYSIEIGSYASRHGGSGMRTTYNCTLCGHVQAQPPKSLVSVTTKEVFEGIENMAITQVPRAVRGIESMKLPDEVLLLVCDYLENQDLWRFAQAWPGRIGNMITAYDVIRTRELMCFCLKKNYKEVKLGVGIQVAPRGKIGSLESEFDLLSQAGFYAHGIRRSVQGIPFEHWLPLPISQKHWRDVKTITIAKLTDLALAANFGNISPAQVVYKFMNDIVIKLNNQATDPAAIPRYGDSSKSTLTHASEKAIESYFHLFHLLLCLAVDDPSIVQDADRDLRNFANGRTSKEYFPDLGHLVVASLISSVDMNEAMLKSMVKEAITRNVVWMLKTSPELSYIEPSAVSQYRLKKTFEASRTSYRILMFQNLFRRTAVGSPRKPLQGLCDEAFERHGAPPRGSAKKLADAIKRIHKVDNFPDFLACMNFPKPLPTAAQFTNTLRDCVQKSLEKGYHSMPIDQGRALYLRQQQEPNVEVVQGLRSISVPNRGALNFFPPKNSNNGGGYRGGRGGGRGGMGRGGY